MGLIEILVSARYVKECVMHGVPASDDIPYGG